MINDCKVKFTEDTAGITAGKIYQISGGFLADNDKEIRRIDSGSPFKDFDDLEEWASAWGATVELVEESNMFAKDDLKVGYVLEFNNNPGRLAMVLPKPDGKLCISGPQDWFLLESVPDDLNYGTSTVTKVFGYSRHNDDAYKLSIKNRDLLWERGAVKEISVSEAEKALAEKFGKAVRIRVGE